MGLGLNIYIESEEWSIGGCLIGWPQLEMRCLCIWSFDWRLVAVEPKLNNDGRWATFGLSTIIGAHGPRNQRIRRAKDQG